MIGRNKNATFGVLKDRILKLINSWSNRSLSRASMEVLIKSMLQAIPGYMMSVFLLPSTLCDEIEKMLNSFWWGKCDHDRRGIH